MGDQDKKFQEKPNRPDQEKQRTDKGGPQQQGDKQKQREGSTNPQAPRY